METAELERTSASGLVEPEATPAVHRWGLGTRIMFRFCVIYFTLFCLSTQILSGVLVIPKVDLPEIASLPPLRPLIFWTAAHLFHTPQPLVYNGSGSGDKTFDWVMCFCFLILSAAATGVWSILDRKRARYPGLLKWFRLFLRYALGGQMLIYGMVKLFPMQMSYPSLIKLLEPYGNFSPMGVLWSSIGASPAYEMLCGSAELLAGILLLIPRTTLLGALVTMGVTSEIFILNMTYDVPVKLLSFHLLLMALFLAAPEFSRLADFFLRDRVVERSTLPPLFSTPRANRIALLLQLTFAAWMLGNVTYGTWTEWPVWGAARPKSALYGIWTVNKMGIDGHERSPLLGDYGRWRRLVFDSPDYMTYQRMNDSFGSYDTAINTKDQSITLTRDDDKKWKGALHYQQPKADALILDGSAGNQPIHLELERVDREKLPLVSRGFHWVQEYPFNR